MVWVRPSGWQAHRNLPERAIFFLSGAVEEAGADSLFVDTSPDRLDSLVTTSQAGVVTVDGWEGSKDSELRRIRGAKIPKRLPPSPFLPFTGSPKIQEPHRVVRESGLRDTLLLRRPQALSSRLRLRPPMQKSKIR